MINLSNNIAPHSQFSPPLKREVAYKTDIYSNIFNTILIGDFRKTAPARRTPCVWSIHIGAVARYKLVR